MGAWRKGEPPTQVARLQNEPAAKSPANFDMLIRLPAPPQRGLLWCANLGEVEYDIEQLVKLRQALSKPTCLITHIFIGPKDLPQRCQRAIDPNRQLLEALAEADTEMGDHGSGSPWH